MEPATASNYPQIRFAINRSALGQDPLHLIANEDKARELELRPGGFADYGLTGFPWVSNTEEIARKALVVSQGGQPLMWLFKGYADNELYYSRTCDWNARQRLHEPRRGYHRHYFMTLEVANGTLAVPVLQHHRSEETLPVRHVRVLFLGADGVELSQNRLAGVVEWSNKALINSHVPLQLDPVGIQEAGYASSDDLSTDLHAMSDDAALAARITELRRLLNAEAVVLVVPGSSPGSGVAWLDSFGTDRPFTVVRVDSLLSSYMTWLLPHEIAHILGVRHGSGYENGQFRTLMNKNFKFDHIQHFSSPHSYHPAPYKGDGTVTGTAAHDSAGILIAKARQISTATAAEGAEGAETGELEMSDPVAGLGEIADEETVAAE